MKATQEIIKAIEKLFGDTSVAPEDTLDALKEIQGEVEMKIGALEADLERNAG